MSCSLHSDILVKLLYDATGPKFETCVPRVKIRFLHRKTGSTIKGLSLTTTGTLYNRQRDQSVSISLLCISAHPWQQMARFPNT